MFYVTMFVILFVLLLSVGLWVVATKFWESDKGFMMFVYSMLVLLFLYGIYLSLAVPTVAEIFSQEEQPTVTQETSNLLEE